MNKSIILLSGGLDSLVSLSILKEKYDIKKALTFNYGQKAYEKELSASKKIANFYNIEHKVIELPWLNEISTSDLNNNKEIPSFTMDDINNKINISKSVIVPNRNALFINIAGCIAEAENLKYIIIGANKEESENFKDNSIDFIKAINTSLKNSTENEIEVIAPLINYTKEEIVRKGIETNSPFELIYSCYKNGEKHCGDCESCIRLKRALQLNNKEELIKELF